MPKRTRKSYTEAQRSQILASAQREDLTAVQVQKKFGVTPVTYYSWRKKKGLVGRRGRRPKALAVVGAGGGDLTSQVRANVQAKVRAVLPGIVRDEVSHYLDSLLGSARGPRHRRGRPRKKK